MTVLLLMLTLAVGSKETNLRAALHVHSTFSTGAHTVEEIARHAAAAGIDVIFLNDHFLDEISYGPPLLREALAFKVRVPSLTPGTMSAYLRASREAEQKTGIIVLPGVELTPYYFWEGSPFTGDSVLRSAGRQLLVVFPDRPAPKEVSRSLVNPASPSGRKVGLSSLLLLWPLLPGIWAIRKILSPPLQLVKTRYYVVKRRARPFGAWLVALLSLVALARSWPFTVPRWSPYRVDAGLAPYEDAVEQAESFDGLTFWAHPESSSNFVHQRYPIRFRSEPYPHFIEQSRGVTGFASLYEGYRKAAAPGGFWDQALLEFCEGQRPEPTWTVGELDLHEVGEAGGKFLGEVETVLRVRERSRKGVLEALRSGAAYAIRHRRKGRLLFEGFTVTSRDKQASMGQRLVGPAPYKIEIRLRREGQSSVPVELELIRNGESVWQESVDVAQQKILLSWIDPTPLSGTSYYRMVGKESIRRCSSAIRFSSPLRVIGLDFFLADFSGSQERISTCRRVLRTQT